jgi:fatty-acyl-CoA synthase
VRITGRIKDMIIRGGENIYPREIEEFLYTHPKVAEAQVFGVADMKMGEEVCAWIKLMDGETATEEEIRDFCRGQITHFKIPRYVRFVDEFPMTVTGKIRKIEMSAMMAEELQAA